MHKLIPVWGAQPCNHTRQSSQYTHIQNLPSWIVSIQILGIFKMPMLFTQGEVRHDLLDLFDLIRRWRLRTGTLAAVLLQRPMCRMCRRHRCAEGKSHEPHARGDGRAPSAVEASALHVAQFRKNECRHVTMPASRFVLQQK